MHRAHRHPHTLSPTWWPLDSAPNSRYWNQFQILWNPKCPPIDVYFPKNNKLRWRIEIVVCVAQSVELTANVRWASAVTLVRRRQHYKKCCCRYTSKSVPNTSFPLTSCVCSWLRVCLQSLQYTTQLRCSLWISSNAYSRSCTQLRSKTRHSYDFHVSIQSHLLYKRLLTPTQQFNNLEK